MASTAALNSKTREASSLSNGISLGNMALDVNVTIGEDMGLVMADVVYVVVEVMEEVVVIDIFFFKIVLGIAPNVKGVEVSDNGGTE
ncbi:hypothetical protein QE152_g18952 [Popillia japonica]|uniref:Uncharacterized protein n=1 Tax=Popillia japonica TaxID=7064 RepID=A0AAW1L4F0_POPJA